MKSKNLMILVVVALVVCVLAITLYQKQNTRKNPTVAENAKSLGDPLLGNLDEKIEEVAQVVYEAGATSITLQRGDRQEWSIASVGGYPADPGKLQQLFFGLTDLRVADVLTKNTERYDRFGLADGKGSKGSLLLKDKGGQTLSQVLMGEERKAPESPNVMSQGGGRFFLVNEDPHVYLAEENMYWLKPELTAWVDTEILSVERGEIQQITLNPESETTGTLILRMVEGDMAIQGVPDGKQGKKSEISSAQGALSYLRLSDVLPADAAETQTLDFETAYIAKVKDGTVYTAKTATRPGHYYLTLEAAYDAPIFTDEDNASTETLAQAQSEAEAAQAAVPDFNAKHSKWVYEIREYNYKNLTKNAGDLLEPIPEPDEAKEED